MNGTTMTLLHFARKESEWREEGYIVGNPVPLIQLNEVT